MHCGTICYGDAANAPIWIEVNSPVFVKQISLVHGIASAADRKMVNSHVIIHSILIYSMCSQIGMIMPSQDKIHFVLNQQVFELTLQTKCYSVICIESFIVVHRSVKLHHKPRCS